MTISQTSCYRKQVLYIPDFKMQDMVTPSSLLWEFQDLSPQKQCSKYTFKICRVREVGRRKPPKNKHQPFMTPIAIASIILLLAAKKAHFY
jgi:hypothetical protein